MRARSRNAVTAPANLVAADRVEGMEADVLGAGSIRCELEHEAHPPVLGLRAGPGQMTVAKIETHRDQVKAVVFLDDLVGRDRRDDRLSERARHQRIVERARDEHGPVVRQVGAAEKRRRRDRLRGRSQDRHVVHVERIERNRAAVTARAACRAVRSGRARAGGAARPSTPRPYPLHPSCRRRRSFRLRPSRRRPHPSVRRLLPPLPPLPRRHRGRCLPRRRSLLSNRSRQRRRATRRELPRRSTRKIVTAPFSADCGVCGSVAWLPACPMRPAADRARARRRATPSRTRSRSRKRRPRPGWAWSRRCRTARRRATSTAADAACVRCTAGSRAAASTTTAGGRAAAAATR